MNAREPPKLATWLLRRLGYGRMSESLVGDLFEQYAEGRSRRWYWRQVLTAILAGFANAVRAHGQSFTRALAAGWAVMTLQLLLNEATVRLTSDLVRGFRIIMPDLRDRDTVLTLAWGTGATIRVLLFVAAGWVVARLHPEHRRTVVLVLIASAVTLKLPWAQLRLFDHGVHSMLFYATAVGGILLGAFFAARSNRFPRAGSRH